MSGERPIWRSYPPTEPEARREPRAARPSAADSAPSSDPDALLRELHELRIDCAMAHEDLDGLWAVHDALATRIQTTPLSKYEATQFVIAIALLRPHVTVVGLHEGLLKIERKLLEQF